MKILLINPLVRKWAQPNVFPLGLGYIASVLRNNNFNVKVLDLNVDRHVNMLMIDAGFRYREFLNDNFDIIGITGIITQYSEVKKIAKYCRLHFPNTPIICGGPLASSIPDLLLEKTEVDLCIRGEGEDTILALIKAIYEDHIMAYNEVPLGVSSKSLTNRIFHMRDTEPIKDLSTIPLPTYDLFPIETYINNPIAAQNTRKWIDGKSEKKIERSMNIIGTRGCPFSCLFCYHNFMGQGYRQRDKLDILMEMQGLVDEYKIEYFHFTDDAFCTNKKWMMEFCDKKIEMGMNVKWSCAGRANVVDEELISTMKDAGCIGLCYGLESGSQKILNRMNKKITLDQYRKAIRLNQKYFEYQDYTFIVGCPGETEKTVEESINFCKEMNIKPSAVFYMTPYPGTPLFKELQESDFLFKDIINDKYQFENWIKDLNEQGNRIAWNCTSLDDDKRLSDEELIELHDRFIEEFEC